MSRQVDIKSLVSHIVRGDGLDKCRICMGDTSQGQVHLTDTVMMDGDKAVTLSELLEVITGVEVECEEALPSALCLSCSDSAYEAASFRILVQSTEHQWTSTVQLLNYIPNHDYDPCSDKITAIISHDLINITDECTIPVEKPKEPPIKRFGKITECQCPICGKKFQYASLLHKHLKESADLLRACHICADVMSRDKLVRHLLEAHLIKPYDCKNCPAMFLNFKPYSEHVITAHAPGIMTCGDCSRSFKSLPAFHAHQSVHSRRSCPNCEKKFQNQMCYTYHVTKCCKLTSKDKNVFKNKENKILKMGNRGSVNNKCICDYCNKIFSAKKYVAAHIEIVHTKTTHKPCQFCGKVFAAAHMSSHLKTHMGHKYECEQCGAILKSKLGFNQHLRLHSGERPYRCDYCGQTFSASSRRSHHIQTKHLKSPIVFKHACSLCPAKFRLPSKLIQHVHKVHKNKECYECVECHEKFSSCRSLLNHSKKHSVEEDDILPPGLCRACAEDVITAAKFKHLCDKSAQRWSDAAGYLSKFDMECEDKTLFFMCADNDIVICEKRTETVQSAVTTLSKYKKAKKKARRKEFACACPFCDKQFVALDLLNDHLKNGQKRVCRDCGLVLSKAELATHLIVAHQKETVDCNVCHDLFKCYGDANWHTMQYHGPNAYTCKDCGCGFKNERALRAHWYSHTLLCCERCGQSFESNACYRHHARNCKSKQKSTFNTYECHDCGMRYDKKPSLKIHILQKHLNVLPFICKTCGKRTSTLPHLRSHEKVHEVNRQLLECHCGAKFRTLLGHRLHMRMHSGVKPYKCNQCEESFISASRRLDHTKRRHKSTKELPHGCEQCPARFIRPWELRKHYLQCHQSVKEETMCPGGVCVTCASAALAAEEFRLFVQNAHRLWLRTIHNLSALPFEYSDTAKSICAFITKTDGGMQVYKDFTGGEPRVVVNRNVKVARKKAKKRTTGQLFSCTDCPKQFATPQLLRVHLLNSDQKDACLLCGEVLRRGEELKKHLESVHNQTFFLCKECPNLLDSIEELREHEKTAHKTGAWTCNACGRQFKYQSAFDQHAQMHVVHTCRRCGHQYTNRSCYRAHRAECEPDAKPRPETVSRMQRTNIRDPGMYVCDYCEKSYNSRPQLQNHILWIHLDHRPHQCSWCGKRFYTAARLSEHTVVHTRVRNFECDICGAKLVTKSAVIYHRRRHTGEKPYVCEDCGAGFISSSRRSEHAKRKHNKGVRFQCSQCPASFVRRKELEKHAEKNHKEQEV